jgi:hypothetical protein
MDGTWFMVLEAHARSATLYLRGAPGAREWEQAVTLCTALPPDVRHLRIEARGVPAEHPALAVLLRALRRRWVATRVGHGGASAVVTVSLHDRGEGVTAHGQDADDRCGALPDAGAAIPQTRSLRGPICASSG